MSWPYRQIQLVHPSKAKEPTKNNPFPAVPLTDEEWSEIRADVILAARHSRAWARLLVAMDRADAQARDVQQILDSCDAYSRASVPIIPQDL